jgi:hypothetical protein
MKQVSQIDWARLAAYIDGEGCILIAKRQCKDWPRPYLYLDVRVTGTDPRLIEWCKDNFGGSVHTSQHHHSNPKGNWAPCFYWVVGCRQANHILENCLPYFIIKREQAEVALAFQRTLGKQGKKVSQDVIDQQYRFREALSNLKGSSSRGKHPVTENITIQ